MGRRQLLIQAGLPPDLDLTDDQFRRLSQGLTLTTGGKMLTAGAVASIRGPAGGEYAEWGDTDTAAIRSREARDAVALAEHEADDEKRLKWAVHEMGHVACSLRVGIPVEWVAIRPNERVPEGYDGRVQHSDFSRAPALDRLITFIGGPTAEMALCPGASESGAWGDFEPQDDDSDNCRVQEILDEIGPGAEIIGEQAFQDAEKIIKQSADRIRRAAKRLVELNSLDADELATFFLNH
jgi:hypothetical protein